MILILIILGFICLLIGFVGCVLPGVAGPPFSFLALILLSIAKKWEPFTPAFLITMAALTVAVQVLDYILPAAGAKRYGATRAGFWGAVIGLIVGLLWAPPLGMILGAYIGAVIGEMSSGKKTWAVFKAGWGTLVGFLFGMLFKLILSAVMAFYFIKALF